jgi:predicted dehydrogenase
MYNRRSFLDATDGQAGGGGGHSVAANDKIVIGVIGLGLRGTQLTDFFCRRPDVEVAWICGADSTRFGPVGKIVEQAKGVFPKTTDDFRRILDDKSIDAVVIATPEHWHAVSAIMACQAGKDVYLEKAGSHTIWEGRKTVEAARKYKRVVQIGLQTRSAPYGRTALEAIRAQKLGKVFLVRVYNMLGERRRLVMGNPEPPPENLNWDMWLGPAPSRPYNPGYLRRLHWDIDGTSLTGDTVHQLDLARWVVGKGFPQWVHHAGGKYVFAGDDSEPPDTRVITYEYGDLTLTIEHADGVPYMHKIPVDVRDSQDLPEWYPFIGTKIEIYGADGMMLLGRVGGGWQIFGLNGEKGPWDKYPHTQMQLDHVDNFISCMRSREKPSADVEECRISAAVCQMGNISYRCGNRKLIFDAASETFADTEANQYLRCTYRAPWVIAENV